ncbi:Dynein light chain 1, cytoplasmic [Linnemannia schmuckeri]|uniref:Dynein light chain 1, cytoplasmic n=1 Tax=Linnemannia schmuckeri TaxID=64567 RepID=A0A9P5S5J9_9FUNG|nr:Dynein light chain 1, cytoplasmic [Linnemannia schmuckeri]
MTTRYSSSESDNSDIEDRNHSRTSTSSVEEDVIKGPNGQSVKKTTTTKTTTTTRKYTTTTDKDGKQTTTITEEVSVNGAPVAPAPTSGFIARVSSLPLIHDSVSTLHSYAKDNKYSRYALDTAGSAVETVSKYTEPYSTRLQPAISKVDQIATKSLDVFETTFPIVTKPTSEIVTKVKQPYVYVEESSKNAYTQIQSTIDTRVTAPVKAVTNNIATTAASTRDQITTVATSTRDQITTVATSTRDQITTAATSTANNITAAATTTATAIATRVNTHATPLVDGLETIVNRVLPADAEVEQSTAGQSNQASRVVDLGRNVSLRVSRRVSVSVAPITQSAQDLRKAAENNAAVIKSKESIQALNIRLNALIEAVRAHAIELQENVQKVPGEASQRVQTLSTSLLVEIDSLSVYLKEHSPKLPVYVQVRLEPLVGFVNDRYVTVKGEMVKPDVSALQKARNILQLTTEETLPILQSAAQEVKESLLQYQVSIQENVHKGITKVQAVNSSVSDAASRAVQTARVTLVGAKHPTNLPPFTTTHTTNEETKMFKDPRATIKSVDMAEEMQQDAIEVAIRAFTQFAIEREMAAYLKKEFDRKYGLTWHCIVGRNFGSFVTHGKLQLKAYFRVMYK